MNKQPEALRLADSLWALMSTVYSNGTLEASAAELRRLYEERTAADGVISDLVEKVRRLHAQRDALLEALRMLVLATKEVSVGRYNEEAHDIALSKARAAIKAAEENT